MNSNTGTRVSTASLWYFFLAFQVMVLPLVPYAVKLGALLLSTAVILVVIQRINRFLFSFIWPLLLIVGIGATLGMGNLVKEPYAFFRDFYYFSQPLLLIFIGFMAIVRGPRSGFRLYLRLLIFAAFFLAIYYYASFIINIFLGISISLDSRYKFALNSDYAMVGFLLVYVSRLTRYKIFQSSTEIVLIIFFLLLIFISLSRTNILISMLVILYPFLAKFISFKKQLYGFVSIIFALVFLGSIFQVALPEEAASGFLSKVLNSYAEVIVRNNVENEVLSAQDSKNVNYYWRSQEAFLGLSKYLEGNRWQLVFGQGFGTYIDASQFFDSKFQQIPFFHNGFITVVLKAGPIGILLYFYFFTSLARRASTINCDNFSRDVLFIQLAVPCVIYASLLKTFFIMGFYAPDAPVLLLILLGLLFAKMGDGPKSTQV